MPGRGVLLRPVRVGLASRIADEGVAPRGARRAPGIHAARPDADSGLESLLRLRLRRLGILLRSQVVIDTVGRVDFLLDGVIILEVDGRLNHEGPSLRHKDLVRDARAAALGYETLRFDYALVVHDWETVRAAILARLEIVRSRMARSRH